MESKASDEKRTVKEADHKLEQMISAILKEIGIPLHIKGYQFLREAILEVVKTPGHLSCVTKSLYPMIGKRYSASANSVERGISRAIEAAWERGDPAVIQKYFNCSVHEKPTSKEFIAVVADVIELQLQY